MSSLFVSLDASGSMEDRVRETVDALNEYMTKVRNVKDLAVTVEIWNSDGRRNLYMGPIEYVPKFTVNDYVCEALTPLLDSFGRAIVSLRSTSGERKLLVLMTDGRENSSHEYNRGEIKKMITDFRASGGEVIFLGADINVGDEGDNLGVSRMHTISYDTHNSEAVFRSIGDTSSGYLSGES